MLLHGLLGVIGGAHKVVSLLKRRLGRLVIIVGLFMGCLFWLRERIVLGCWIRCLGTGWL